MSGTNEVRRARPLLGTLVEIRAAASWPEARLHAALDAAFAAVERVQALMSFHDPASELSELNREAAQRPVAVDAQTCEVLAAALQLSRLSEGAFDVCIGAHLQEWGYLPRYDDQPCSDGFAPLARAAGGNPDTVSRSVGAGGVAPAHTPAPTVPGTVSSAQGQGERAAQHPDWRDIELQDDGRVRFHRPLRIDLGGIAKGYAVDRAVETLRQAGVDCALVNAGGDLRAFGASAWTVSLRHPASPAHGAHRLELRDEALATSANYYSRRGIGHSEVSPLLDPRSHRPWLGRASVSVRAPRCLHADALTKVVLFAAPDVAERVLAAFDAQAYVLDPEQHRHTGESRYPGNQTKAPNSLDFRRRNEVDLPAPCSA